MRACLPYTQQAFFFLKCFMKNFSLHSRLLIASMVPVSILMIFFSFLVVLFRFQDIDTLKEETAHILLSKYSFALAQASQENWAALINNALEEKYLYSIDIFDSNGKNINHAGPHSTLKILNSSQLGLLKNKVNYLPYANADIFLHAIEIPQATPHLSQKHWLAIQLRPAFFTIARYEVVIGTSIISFGFISILMLWISGNIRYWLNPLHTMMQQLQQIEPQKLEKRLNANGVGDIDLLEQHINNLLNKISFEHQELHQYIDQAKADLEENLITIETHNIELRLARNAAIEGNRTKSAFLANISHELRTPLNSINGFTSLLLKMDLPHKQRDWIETIQKSSNNLLAIINDVLDYSKIEAGKFSLQVHPFNLENTIFEVLETLAPQAESKGLEQIAFIYEEVPIQLEGDALRLKQILTNLVSNAIRFTKQGEIVVRVMLEETRNEQHLIKISISDTGKGLSANEKSHLFTAFQQGNPTLSREAGGTGLGLVISKSLVKLMDGDIGFDSEKIQGATFWFTFKVKDDTQAEPHTATLLTNKHILVLESHEKNSQLLKSTLFNANADVKVVKKWLDLSHAIQEPYEVIVLDSRDLEPECYHQIYTLRQRFSGMIVLLTGLNDIPSLPESAFNELSIYNLTKPLRPLHLLNLLGQGFSTARFKKSTIDVAPIAVNLHILAVDDHPLNLKLVCTLLEDFGIKVSQAESGQQAITLCQQHHFDLIFMDIQMPQMSGLEATNIIRNQENLNQKTPIVALTAHALADEQENMQHYGMNDYLTKPLQESQLVHIILRWTGINLQNTAASTDVINLVKKPHFALLDWEECLKLSAGKRDLALDIIKMLIDGVPSSKEKLSKSLSEYNLPALLAHTHYLHGATRYCGVPQLRHLTRQLEISIKESLKYKTDNEAHVKEQIKQQVDEVLNQLDALFILDLAQMLKENEH